MNRKQRRNLDKKGYDGDKIAAMLGVHKAITDAEDDWIKEGEKIKLNVARIKHGKDWNRLADKYKTFIEDNSDIVFTVKFEEKFGEYPSLVTFQEDSTWLFHVEDLIRL